jgi:hypothetical protein
MTASEFFTEIGGDSGSFQLESTNFVSQVDWPTVSLAVLEDGVIRALKGCRGSVTFTANLGEPMYMDFEFRGLPCAAVFP